MIQSVKYLYNYLVRKMLSQFNSIMMLKNEIISSIMIFEKKKQIIKIVKHTSWTYYIYAYKLCHLSKIWHGLTIKLLTIRN